MSNTLNPAGIVEPYAATAIRGRFGYHVCDHATYLKAKELNKLYFRLLKAIAARWRYERKTVYKGVQFHYQRNEKGQRCGRAIRQGVVKQAREIPTDIYRKVLADGFASPKNRRGWRWHTDFDWVPHIFKACRMPQPSPVPVMTQEAADRIEYAIKELKGVLGE